MITFTPQVKDEPVLSPGRRSVIANLPEEGTRIRATLGDTVIDGTVRERTGFPLISIRPLGSPYHYVDCWLADGWQFDLVEVSK